VFYDNSRTQESGGSAVALENARVYAVFVVKGTYRDVIRVFFHFFGNWGSSRDISRNRSSQSWRRQSRGVGRCSASIGVMTGKRQLLVFTFGRRIWSRRSVEVLRFPLSSETSKSSKMEVVQGVGGVWHVL
jgi:hypothetical protein